MDVNFITSIAWDELYNFINVLLEFDKTGIIDNGMHIAINLIGSIETCI